MDEVVSLVRDGPVATLQLDRPQALNTLDVAMMERLVERAQEVAADASIRCVVVRGAGRHFMAGGDLNTFDRMLADEPDPARRVERFLRMIDRLHGSIEVFRRMDKPLVASVHGAVAGFGLSLVLAADFAIADESAYFNSAYRHIGLTPDGGCTFFLPRLVGTRKAMEIVLLGERIGAADALALGLVNRVVPAGELEAATAALVAKLVSGPARAIANGKRLVNESLERTLSEQLAAEAASFSQCAGTGDFAEGVRAFLAKRTPRFGNPPGGPAA